MMFRAIDACNLAKIHALVETPPLKRYRKCLQPLRTLRCRIVQDRRRIHTSRRPHSQRHVRHQMLPHRVAQEPVEFHLRIGQRNSPLLMPQAPPRFDARPPVAPIQQMPGRHFSYSLDQRPLAGNVVDRKVLIERLQVQPPRNLGVLQDRLEFRPEVDIVAAPVVVQRLDAHAVADQHQPPFRFPPQRHREHSAESFEASRVPLLEPAKHGLGIAVGPEPVPQRLQLGPHLSMIVDFTVERNYGVAVLADERLIAAREVDDLQSDRA